MLIALNIEEYARTGIGRMLNLFRHNRIRVGHLYCDSAAVRSVVYEHRRGRISWETIGRFVRERRASLLCPEGLDLPEESGLRRFCGHLLNRRLCENAALYLLRAAAHASVPARVSTALIDDSGEHAALCPYLADETDCLTVVTRSPGLYLSEADRILEERGAVVHISTGDSPLAEADLILSPGALTRAFPCAPDAVILSGEPAAVTLNAPVVCGYTFDLPDKYRSIRPPYLDEMYFAEALYALGGAHELGASMFRRCYDGRILHTRVSLLEQLRVRLENRKN